MEDAPHESDVLTVRELADWLRLGENTVRQRAEAGTIPAKDVGTGKSYRRWRFSRRAILAWLESNAGAVR